MDNPISQKLYEKFFSDPDWKAVERVISDYIDPLMDMSSVDTNQPAEEVKAETIRIMTAGKKQSGFIFNSGEMIPRETPVENMIAMVQTAKQLSHKLIWTTLAGEKPLNVVEETIEYAPIFSV